MVEDIWNELAEGEIHLRDQLQFELKNEFIINPRPKQNVYKQEVFLFIPSSLQINSQTYSKQQFYLDQTNLIRYKTPLIELSDLVNPDYSPSPLNRLQGLLKQEPSPLILPTASDELKLFGAIFRASVRDRVRNEIKNIKQMGTEETASHTIPLLCSEITLVCNKFRELQEVASVRAEQNQLILHFKFIDEFISNVSEEFLLLLLKELRSLDKQNPYIDKQICQLIHKEKMYRKKNHLRPKTSKGHLFANESILYREGLLNHFVLEALALKNHRFSSEEKQTPFLAAIAAGLAMFFYMGLLAWKSSTLVINSYPFVALAVFLYIIKDRLKEGMKTLYYKQMHRWFPDFSTVINNFKGFKVGLLTENFAFIEPKDLPPGFWKIRNHYFHEELPALERHEAIIQYKRTVSLNPTLKTVHGRRKELTTIFRLNIHRFLEKASNPFQETLNFDPLTHELTEKLLPKVYHLNLIIRNSTLQNDLTQKEEIKTFRVIIDKRGIKRVEHIENDENRTA